MFKLYIFKNNRNYLFEWRLSINGPNWVYWSNAWSDQGLKFAKTRKYTLSVFKSFIYLFKQIFIEFNYKVKNLMSKFLLYKYFCLFKNSKKLCLNIFKFVKLTWSFGKFKFFRNFSGQAFFISQGASEIFIITVFYLTFYVWYLIFLYGTLLCHKLIFLSIFSAKSI